MKKLEKNRKNVLTKWYLCGNIYLVTESYGSIAQLGEHLPYKQRVTGSSPVVPTNLGDNNAGLAHLVERHLAKVEVASSSLVTRSRNF